MSGETKIKKNLFPLDNHTRILPPIRDHFLLLCLTVWKTVLGCKMWQLKTMLLNISELQFNSCNKYSTSSTVCNKLNLTLCDALYKHCTNLGVWYIGTTFCELFRFWFTLISEHGLTASGFNNCCCIA